MHGDDVVVAQTETVHGGRSEVLAHDVELRRKAQDQVTTPRVLEIDADAPLAQVVAKEGVPDGASEWVVHRRQRTPPGLTCDRVLDLHDLGAEPSEQLRAVGQRLHLLQSEDAHTFQRPGYSWPLSHPRTPGDPQQWTMASPVGQISTIALRICIVRSVLFGRG